MEDKIIKTDYQRIVSLLDSNVGVETYLRVEDTTKVSAGYVQTRLSESEAVELGTALLEAAGQEVFNTEELPKVTEGWNDDRLHSNNVGANLTDDPKKVFQKALGLLAIAKELEKRQAEALERNKAEAKAERERNDKLNERREELANELSGGRETRSYIYCTPMTRKAIDKIIELEDAQPKKYEL